MVPAKNWPSPKVSEMWWSQVRRLTARGSSLADLLRAFLRGGQPLQAAAHLLGEDCGHVQGEEAPRDAAPHLCHC